MVQTVDGGESEGLLDRTLSGLQDVPEFVGKVGADIYTGAQKAATDAFESFTKGHPLGSSGPGRVVNAALDRFVFKPQREHLKSMDERGLGGIPGKIVQGGAGGLIGGGGAGARAAAMAVAGGAGGAGGSELAAKWFGDNALARTIGAIIGGMSTGTAASKLTSIAAPTKALALEAIEGIDPKNLVKAQAYQIRMGKAGTPIDLAQALEAIGEPASNLTTLRNVLANSKEGNKVQGILREQPKMLELAADTTVAKLPGNVYQPDVIANNAQELATQIVERAKKSRSASVRELYAQVGELPEEAQRNILSLVKAQASAPGATDGLKKAAEELTEKIAGRKPEVASALAKARERLAAAATPIERQRAQAQIAVLNRQANEINPIHALDADTALSDAVGPYKGTPMSPVDPKTSGQVRRLAGDVNEGLQKGSPEIAAAEARYRQISQDIVDPLKQGPVGQLMTPRGYKPDVPATQSKLEGIFNAGTDPQAGGPSRILSLAKEFNKADKNAFPDAVKSHLSQKIAKVMSSAPEGDPMMAQKLWDTLFSSRTQHQGLRDMAAGVADAHGLPRKEVVRGLENLMQLTKAMKSRPGTVGGLKSDEIFKLGSLSPSANAMRVFGFLPFERAARAVEDVTLGRTLRHMDDILTSPEGAKKLMELGKVPVMSDRAATIFGTLIAAEQQQN